MKPEEDKHIEEMRTKSSNMFKQSLDTKDFLNLPRTKMREEGIEVKTKYIVLITACLRNHTCVLVCVCVYLCPCVSPIFKYCSTEGT